MNVWSNTSQIIRVGPSLGSFLAVAIYAIMKRFKYWKLNEGQDTDESSKSPALFFQEESTTEPSKPENRAPSMRVLPSIAQTLSGDEKRAVVQPQPQEEDHQQLERERERLMVNHDNRQGSNIEEMVWLRNFWLGHPFLPLTCYLFTLWIIRIFMSPLASVQVFILPMISGTHDGYNPLTYPTCFS